MASVTIKAVKKNFGATPILHGVDIDIADGSFTVLVGPSGCGKSTLLRMIAGLEHISGGEIRIGDRRVNELPPKERDIAMVFQNYALYPHMTVRENMAFSLALAKMEKTAIETKVARAADILALGALMDRYPRQLSGGQRQRVAMGRAIVRDPRCSCLTSRSRTSMPNCAWPCAARSRSFISALKPPRSTSPMTRSKP